MNTNIPMPVKIKLLYEDSQMPIRGTEFSAGFDCFAQSKSFDRTNGCIDYGLGFAIEIPVGHVGLIFPRSSIYKTECLLTNCVGVIDSDYRGEVRAKFKPFTDKSYHIGERCCQLIIIPYPRICLIESNELSITDRGIGGYGSTGIN